MIFKCEGYFHCSAGKVSRIVRRLPAGFPSKTVDEDLGMAFNVRSTIVSKKTF